MSSLVSQKEQTILTADSSFHFHCHDALPCFTQCCQDVNIYLSPYDILRLRRALKISSTEVLEKYTRHFLARVTNIPVVQLEMDPQTLRCKFVTEQGCRVYIDRPWACRMYPLDLGSQVGEYQMIVGKERCLGLLEPGARSVQEWLDTQDVASYVEMEYAFHSVMPERFKPGAPMDAGLGKLLFFAYDLDRFAQLLDDSRFKSLYEIDDARLRELRENDEELLRLAFLYIRNQMEMLYE